MRRLLTIIAVALILVPAAMLASAATNDPAGDVVRTLETILAEAQRQERVSGDITVMIRDFRRLVEDLTSNGLVADAKGQELMAMADELDTTDRSHVRTAAGKLRDAAAARRGRKPHIVEAAAEIRAAVGRIKSLLRDANALRAGDMLVGELDIIIREQERLLERSTALGRDMLAGKTDLPAGDELRKDLENTAGSISEFEKVLNDALIGEMSVSGRSRFEAVDRILTGENVKGRIDLAAENLSKMDVMSAVAEQKQALRATKEMLRALQPDSLEPLIEARQELASILNDQAELRKGTDTTAEQFGKSAASLRLEQANLARQLAGAATPLAEAAKSGMPATKVAEAAIENATIAMAAAEKAIGNLSQKPAVDAQSAAEKELADAIGEIDRQIKDARAAAELAAEMARREPWRDFMEAKKALQDILKGQGELRRDTGVPGEKFALKAGELRAGQAELAGQLANAPRPADPAAREAARLMDAAQRAMDAAEAALGESRQHAAMDQQALAEEDITGAIDELDTQIMLAKAAAQKAGDKAPGQSLARLREAKRGLEELRDAQGDLRKTTEVPADEFKKTSGGLKAEQADLAKKLGSSLRPADPAMAETQDSIDAAGKAIGDAARELGQRRQEEALAAQAAADDLLSKAIDRIDEQVSQAKAAAQRRAETEPGESLRELRETRKALDGIREHQALLRRESAAPDDQFNGRAEALGKKQSDLAGQLDNAPRPPDTASEAARKAMDGAEQAMKAAGKAIAERRQKEAAEAQAVAGNQLDNAISELDERIKDGESAGLAAALAESKPLQDLMNARRGLEEVRRDQAELRKDSGLPGDRFDRKAGDLATRQAELAKKAEEASHPIDPAMAPAESALVAAEEEMNVAEQAIGDQQQKKAVDAQIAAENQLDNAIGKIGEEIKAAEAAEAMTEATVAMEELERLREAKQGLQSIKNDQGELRRQASVSKDQFDTKAADLRDEQADLAKKLEDTAKSKVPGTASEAAEKAIQDAGKSMKAAEKALGGQQQPEAIEAQALAEAQLDGAIGKLDDQIKDAEAAAAKAAAKSAVEELNQLREARQGLENIRENQGELIHNTDVPKDEFNEQAEILRSEQGELAKKLGEASRMPGNQMQAAAESARAAEKAMKAAEKALGDREQQAAIESQAEARNELDSAIGELDEQIKEAEKAAEQAATASEAEGLKQLQEAVKGLEQIRQGQGELQKQTDLPGEQFAAMAEALKSEQAALASKLEEAAQKPGDANQGAKEAMEGAKKAMAAAEQALGEKKQQEAAQAQAEAAAQLDNAIGELKEQAAEAEAKMVESQAMSDLAEAKKDFEDILQSQDELMKETAGAKDDFQKKSDALGAKQGELAKKLDDASKMQGPAEQQAKAAMKAAQQAREAMKEAEKALGQQQQDKAMAAQAKAAGQLEAAVKDMEAQINAAMNASKRSTDMSKGKVPGEYQMDLQGARKGLEEMLKNQSAIRLRTAGSAERFVEESRAIRVAQAELNVKMASVPHPSDMYMKVQKAVEEAEEAMRMAVDAMEASEQALGRQQRDLAMDAQAVAESQLARAINAVDEQMKVVEAPPVEQSGQPMADTPPPKHKHAEADKGGGLAETLEALERILESETELRGRTSVKKEEFEQMADPLKQAQINLSRLLAELPRMEDDAVIDAKVAVKDAAKAMKEAEKALGELRQDDAIVAEMSVERQLESAIGTIVDSLQNYDGVPEVDAEKHSGGGQHHSSSSGSKEGLQSILSSQEQLRKNTEGAQKEQFNQQSAQMRSEQAKLASRMERAARQSQSSNEKTSRSMREAAEAMRRAEQALGERQQQQAAQAQSDAESQLSDAIKNFDVEPMEGESDSVQQNFSQPKGKKASKSQKKGSAPQGKRSPLQNSSEKDPATGRKDFVKTSVYGERPGADNADINSTGDSERGTKDETFVRQLPREYRDMLKAYYEKLSKE
ncbi:MAG: hypothetical protein WCL44_01245 [bacterium]